MAVDEVAHPSGDIRADSSSNDGTLDPNNVFAESTTLNRMLGDAGAICGVFPPDQGTGTQLIELVKPYPELYDKSHPLYCNNAHKGVLWSKIAKELGAASAKKTREQFSYMRKRFKVEYKARQKGQRRPLVPDPDSANYRQPLFVYEQLSFLEDVIERERENSQELELMDAGDGESSVSMMLPGDEEGTLFLQNPELGNFFGESDFGDGLPMMEPVDIKPNVSGSRKRRATISPPDPLPMANNDLMSSNQIDPNVLLQLAKVIADGSHVAMQQNASIDEEECRLFGKQVAMDLRVLSPMKRAFARYRIGTVLMEMTLKELQDSEDATAAH